MPVYFLQLRVIDACNSLPAWVINCGTIGVIFKNRNDSFFKYQGFI